MYGENEHRRKGKRMRVMPIFLLGSTPSFVREDGLGFRTVREESEQNLRTDEILHQLKIEMEPKGLIRKDEDFDHLDVDADAFVIFAHCLERFPSLITLADTGIPIILAGEEGAPGDALDKFEYLADYENVKMVFNFEEIRQRIRILKAVKYVTEAKICLFDKREYLLEETGWHKNPLLRERLKTQYIDVPDFENRYKNVNKVEAERLARKWMDDSNAIEPSLEDVIKSACLYIAMKDIVEDTEADAAYVLWCGQFTKMLGTKMCFAIAKLNDAGYLTGCWRGENLLPTLILHSLSEKPVFFGEVHMYRDGIIGLRHCAVSQKMTSCKYVLRRWRDQEGTVTGYCELLKGEVTIVNCGMGDNIVAISGDVIDCKDIGGDNCRITVWVEVEDKLIHNLVGREVAMVYGNYVEEAKEVGIALGVKSI